MISIKRRLHQLAYDQTALIHDADSLADRIQTYIQLHSKKSAQLESLQRSTQSSTICVFSDGTFEPFDNISLKLDDSGHERLYDELLRHPACRTICLNDIQVLARTLCAVRNSPEPLVPLFENDVLEPIYAALQSERTLTI